jgi:hypothetical protein
VTVIAAGAIWKQRRRREFLPHEVFVMVREGALTTGWCTGARGRPVADASVM